MLLQILLTVMTISATAHGSGWDDDTSGGNGMSFADELRGIVLAAKRWVGAKIPLDPRLDEIVLPDGRSLVTGTQRQNPTLTMALRGYDKTGDDRAYSLGFVVRETRDTAVHYESLKELAVYAHNGSPWALQRFEDLFANHSCKYPLPWKDNDADRSAWFKTVFGLREKQLASKTEEEKEAARVELVKMLQPQVITVDNTAIAENSMGRRAENSMGRRVAVRARYVSDSSCSSDSEFLPSSGRSSTGSNDDKKHR